MLSQPAFWTSHFSFIIEHLASLTERAQQLPAEKQQMAQQLLQEADVAAASDEARKYRAMVSDYRARGLIQ